MPQILPNKGNTATFEEIKRIRESLWHRMRLIEEMNKNSSNNDRHIHGEQKEMACKTEVISVAADGSSFKCIVFSQKTGTSEIMRRKTIVESLVALIDKF